jgi:hypothetical protein
VFKNTWEKEGRKGVLARIWCLKILGKKKEEKGFWLEFGV